MRGWKWNQRCWFTKLSGVIQRAKMTRLWGKTASKIDHPFLSVILQLFAGETWSVVHGNHFKNMPST